MEADQALANPQRPKPAKVARRRASGHFPPQLPTSRSDINNYPIPEQDPDVGPHDQRFLYARSPTDLALEDRKYYDQLQEIQGTRVELPDDDFNPEGTGPAPFDLGDDWESTFSSNNPDSDSTPASMYTSFTTQSGTAGDSFPKPTIGQADQTDDTGYNTESIAYKPRTASELQTASEIPFSEFDMQFETSAIPDDSQISRTSSWSWITDRLQRSGKNRRDLKP